MKGLNHIKLLKWTARRMWLLNIAAAGLVTNTSQATDESKTNAPVISLTNTALDASEQLSALHKQVNDVAAAYGAYTNAVEGNQKEKLWEAYVQANDSA